MKQILVTGATGFIGSHVVQELLQRGYEVHTTVHSGQAPPQQGLVQHKLDLLDPAAVDSFLAAHHFGTLAHLAWYVGPKCHVHPLNLNWLSASLHLLQSFAQHGGHTFLGAGTCSEYEYAYGYLTEQHTPTHPGTLYGAGKNSLFRLADIFCEQKGLAFKWPRIFNLYGPREKPQRLMPSVICSCLRGEDVRVSDCLKFQDYLHVEDTARGIVDTLESELRGAVNICSGRPVQLRDIVSTIAELTHFTGRILWGAVPAAFGDELVVGNNSLLKSIGWAPRFTLHDGLLQTINWWKQHV
ncbi:MAG: NAD(P)-dependent oxidoreductase [Akkermansiaceae bacterium]|nr:NAD(P)-dependent oxidoreductase [Akkermansiaceae bacterium]